MSKQRSKRKFVVRTIKNSEVLIYGVRYKPHRDANRFNGIRAVFGLYYIRRSTRKEICLSVGIRRREQAHKRCSCSEYFSGEWRVSMGVVESYYIVQIKRRPAYFSMTVWRGLPSARTERLTPYYRAAGYCSTAKGSVSSLARRLTQAPAQIPVGALATRHLTLAHAAGYGIKQEGTLTPYNKSKRN